jgi:hypothetical protein
MFLMFQTILLSYGYRYFTFSPGICVLVLPIDYHSLEWLSVK